MSRIFDTLKKFPSTDFHELNLDWIIKKIKDLDTMFHDIQVTSFNGRKGDVVPKSGDYSIDMIPELDENIAKITDDLENIQFLGYTIPKEMKIHNYKDSNGDFHQRVGRVDLGSLNWFYSEAVFSTNSFDIKNYGEQYCTRYEFRSGSSMPEEKQINSVPHFRNNSVNVKDSSYTSVTAFNNSLQGVYLYYELANEVVIRCGKESRLETIFASWNTYTTYSVNDIVMFDNDIYICIIGNNNIVPTNVSYWQKTNISTLITSLLNR